MIATRSSLSAVALAVAALASPCLNAAPAKPRGAASFFVVEATSLKQGPKVLFLSDAKVSIGAAYSPRAIRVTVAAATKAHLAIWTGKAPRNVFIGLEKLDAAKWTYQAKSQHVRLAIEPGTTKLEIRFDDLASLAPVVADVPLVLCDAKWQALQRMGTIKLVCGNDRARGRGTWEGPGGVYRARAVGMRAGAGPLRMAVSGVAGISASGSKGTLSADAGAELMLLKAATIGLSGATVATMPPLKEVQLQLVTRIAAMRQVSKQELAAKPGVLIEAEAFTSEGGGKIKKSTEHGNTSGGACIWSWSTAGHWIAWRFNVAKAGRYTLAITAATAEEVAIRGLAIDGQPVPGAGLVAFTRTGSGWGRSDPAEWQAFTPVDGTGKPITIVLSRGKHELRLKNELGQHLNVDCILLTPVK